MLVIIVVAKLKDLKVSHWSKKRILDGTSKEYRYRRKERWKFNVVEKGI
jgi:hypothetical protein